MRDAINKSWNSPQTQHVLGDVELIASDDESLKASELRMALNHSTLFLPPLLRDERGF